MVPLLIILIFVTIIAAVGLALSAKGRHGKSGEAGPGFWDFGQPYDSTNPGASPAGHSDGSAHHHHHPHATPDHSSHHGSADAGGSHHGGFDGGGHSGGFDGGGFDGGGGHH